MKVMYDDGAYPIQRAYEMDAGYDLRSRESVIIAPCESWDFDVGVHMQIPEGWCGIVIAKSGLNMKKGILTTGLVDAGYIGSVHVKLYNFGKQYVNIQEGDKIAQIVIVPCMITNIEEVQSIDGTERGDRGFGSSGR